MGGGGGVAMPTDNTGQPAVLALDASLQATITLGTYGASNTDVGRIASAWGVATQATQAATPVYDDLGLLGGPAIVTGAYTDAGPSWAAQGYTLPSITYSVPCTIAYYGRIDGALLATLFELSTNVGSAKGFKLGTGSISAPSLTVHNGSTQTSTFTSPWTPASLGASLASWRRSDLGVTAAAGTISAWADQASGAPTVTATGAAMPTYAASGGVNNRAVLSAPGGGTTALTSATALNTAPPYWMFDVTNSLAGTEASNNGVMSYGVFIGLRTHQAGSAGYTSDISFNGASAPSTASAVHLTETFGDTYKLAVAIDGVARVLGSNGPPASNLGAPTIMAGPGVSSMGGSFYELAIASRMVTPIERLYAYNYYQNLYGDGRWVSDNTPHLVVITSDGTDAGLTVSVDGNTLARATNATAPGAGTITTAGTFGFDHASGTQTIGAHGMLYVYNGVLSAPKLAQIAAYRAAKWPKPQLTPAAQAVDVQGFGDSTMIGIGLPPGVDGLADTKLTLLGRIAAYRGGAYGQPTNNGIAGTLLVQGGSNINGVIAAKAFSTVLDTFAIVLGGINDVDSGGRTGAQGIADWTTVLQTCQTKFAATGRTGGKLLVLTITSVNSGNAARLQINTWLLANATSFATSSMAVAVGDIGGDIIMGNNTGASAWFADILHPNSAGYERQYAIVAPAIVSLGLP